MVLLVGAPFQDLQQISATHQLFQCAYTEARHQLTCLFGDEAEHVDHHLRHTDKVLGAQALILGGDTHGTVVEVTDTQILAAQCNHRCGTEAEALSTEDGRLDHIETGLQTAVGLQTHLVAQVVGAQDLVGLGEPQLPWGTGILDRGKWACTGAAVVTGDGDQVGVGLGHTGGDGADTGL